jgi:Spy/CpxP family protein refolding chaperone
MRLANFDLGRGRWREGEIMIRTRTVLTFNLILSVFFLLHPGIASAQNASPRVTSQPTGDDYQPITDEEIQMMRKDIRSQRKQIIAANMRLTDAEAEKFWPIYEQYISELVKLNGPKYALVKQYVQTGGALTDTEAESAVKQWVDIDQSLAQLRMKYISNFRKVLSPKNTALFYQLDRRVQLMIDLQLATALPPIQP